MSAHHRAIGKIGAHVAHSRHDSRDMTAAARAASASKWQRQADELYADLPAEERARRAEHLRKAHFARMGAASAEKRRKSAK